MTLNTYIAGEAASGHALADFFTRRAEAVHDKATGWHDARAKAEAEWDGPASEAFIANRATPNARDADALARIDRDLAPPFTAWGDGITAAKGWMERAKQVAQDADLIVLIDAIYPPKAFDHLAPQLPPGRVTATDSAAHTQAKTEFDAAKALHAKQQAAFDEAKVLVQQARDLERKSHDELRDALTRQTEAIKGLGQFKQWSQVARSATTPAASELMALATDLENKSVHATHAAFEKAAAQGPFATNSMWSALTSEQRADLISRYPQMVGSTNGVPVVDRDIANRSILAAQRQALVERLRYARAEYGRNGDHPNASDGIRVRDLETALEQLDLLEGKLGSSAKDSGFYLLGIDSTAADRGQVIIASGNPDTADHVVTMVPGTLSDLGDALDYVNNGERLSAQAQQYAPGESFAHITYSGYTSPPDLAKAADGSYADQGKVHLAEFQDGLTATRSPDAQQPHRTIIGHSYGGTLVGYAARDYGMPVDDMVFMGTPGTGVNHASELLPHGNVWAATAPWDPVPALSPDIWYGPSAVGDGFGANSVPVSPDGDHNTYWDEPESLNGMAKIAAGEAHGTGTGK